jgi:hypothetical protein
MPCADNAACELIQNHIPGHHVAGDTTARIAFRRRLVLGTNSATAKISRLEMQVPRSKDSEDSLPCKVNHRCHLRLHWIEATCES